MQFNTNSEKKPIPDSESDPQVVEKLYFHEVQGRRYLGSRAFLESVDCQFAIRLMLVASEPLRILTFKWLSNLEFSKADTRCPLHTLFDPNENSVNVCLETIASYLMDENGFGRVRFLWGPTCRTFSDWCCLYSGQVRHARLVLMSLSAWIYRRHVVYWEEFPWPLASLAIISDPQANPEVKATILERWDQVFPCCVRPGLARDLKTMGVGSGQLQPGSKLPHRSARCLFPFRFPRWVWCE